MKKLLWLLLLPLPCSAQYAPVQGYCYQGGTQALTQGIDSANYLQGIINACTVTVYDTGTSNLATIYSNSTGTPLSNPFTASAVGQWTFYATMNQGYDVVGSGGGGDPTCTTAPNCYVMPVTLFVDQYPSQGEYCPIAGCVFTGPVTDPYLNGVYTVDGATTGYVNYAAAENACIANSASDQQNYLNGIGTVAQPGCTIFGKYGAHGAGIDTLAGPVSFQIGCNGTSPNISCTGGVRCQTVGSGTTYKNCFDISVAEYFGPWGDFTRPGPLTYSSYLTLVGDTLGNTSNGPGPNGANNAHGTQIICADQTNGCWDTSLWSIANNDDVENISFVCASGNTKEPGAYLDYAQQATGGFTNTTWRHVIYQGCYGDSIHFGGASNQSATPWQQSHFYDVQVLRPCPYISGPNAGIGSGFALYAGGNGGSDAFDGGVYSTQPCMLPGTGASAVAVLSGTSVASFTNVVGGSGFTTGCTVKVQGNGCIGVTASCSVSGGQAVPSLTSGGSNCQGVPTVTITGELVSDTFGPNGGTNIWSGVNSQYQTFTGTSYSIANNVVTGYQNLIGGVCTGTPTCSVTGSGSGATCSPSINGGTVTSLTLTGGSGYTSAGITFSGCTGASAVPIVSAGVLTEAGYGVVPVKAGQFIHFPITGTTGAWTTSPATNLNNTTPQITSASSATVGTCPGATCGQVQQTITFNTSLSTTGTTSDSGVGTGMFSYYGVVGTVGSSAFTITSNGTTATVTAPTTVPLPNPVYIYINGCSNSSLTALNGHVWTTNADPVYANYTSSTNGIFYPGENATITFPWTGSVSTTTDTCVGYVEASNYAAPFVMSLDKAIVEGGTYLAWLGGGNSFYMTGDHGEGGTSATVTNGFVSVPMFVPNNTLGFDKNWWNNGVARNNPNAFLFQGTYSSAPATWLVSHNYWITPANVYVGNCPTGNGQVVIFDDNNTGNPGSAPGPSCGFITTYIVPASGTSEGSLDPGPAPIIAIAGNSPLCYIPVFLHSGQNLKIKELSTNGSIVGPGVLSGCSYTALGVTTPEVGNFDVNSNQQGSTTMSLCQYGMSEWTWDDQEGLWKLVSAPSCPSLNVGFPQTSGCVLPNSPSSGANYNVALGSSFCIVNSANLSFPNPRSAVITPSEMKLSQDPGSGNTVTATLWVGGSASSLTCTITGNGSSNRSCPITGTITAAANSAIYWDIVPVGSSFPSGLSFQVFAAYQ